jgi:hypothetical protein
MIHKNAVQKRDKLATQLGDVRVLLRGSLFKRMLRHSRGCPKCAGGGGHPLWVLNVNYPGGRTRQISLRPEQVPAVRKALQQSRQIKRVLESISELNQQLLRSERSAARAKEHTP